MPVYKLLYLDDRREKAFSGLVPTDHGDSWDSPIEALNELAATGWETLLPIYGPVPGEEHGGQFVEALLLLNKTGTPIQDIKRRIGRTRAQIAATQERLAGAKSGMDEIALNQHIRGLSSQLAELESRLHDEVIPHD